MLVRPHPPRDAVHDDSDCLFAHSSLGTRPSRVCQKIRVVGRSRRMKGEVHVYTNLGPDGDAAQAAQARLTATLQNPEAASAEDLAYAQSRADLYAAMFEQASQNAPDFPVTHVLNDAAGNPTWPIDGSRYNGALAKGASNAVSGPVEDSRHRQQLSQLLFEESAQFLHLIVRVNVFQRPEFGPLFLPVRFLQIQLRLRIPIEQHQFRSWRKPVRDQFCREIHSRLQPSNAAAASRSNCSYSSRQFSSGHDRRDGQTNRIARRAPSFPSPLSRERMFAVPPSMPRTTDAAFTENRARVLPR